jgi:hypothetical protein
MTAKYPGHCQYCPEPIEPGDEITRGNGGRHASYSHARCVPAAGVLTRARFEVVVTVADERGWIPTSYRKQYVHESLANGCANSLRNCGATVEVRPLV